MSVSVQRARLDFHLPLEPSRLLRARQRIRDYLHEHGVNGRTVDQIVLVIEEAMTNAVRHSDATEDLEVRVSFRDTDLVAEVRDHGKGFDCEAFDLSAPPDLFATGGRGLFLINRLSDELDLRCYDGLAVHLVKHDALPDARQAATGVKSPLPTLHDERDERRRTMLEEIPEMYAALDWEFRYLYVNGYFKAVTGRRSEELLGACLWDLFPEVLGTDVERRLRDAMELGIASRYEFYFAPLDSWFEQRTYPTSFGISQFSVPINERKRKELERDEFFQALSRSQARLETVLQTAHMAYWDWDATTGVTVSSGSATEVFGLRSDQPLPNNYGLHLVHADDRPRYQALVRSRGERGEGWHTEFRIVRPRDGAVAWLEELATAERDAATGKVHHTGLVWDITERKLAEEARRQSHARYRELVQHVNSAIIRWSRDGLITFFNDYAQQLFGWSAEEALGRPVSMLMPGDDQVGDGLQGLPAEILAHPEDHTTNVNENVCRDGRRIWMTWTNRAIVDEHGEVAEILAVGNDITGLKEAEAELAETTRLSSALNDINELVHSTLDVDEIMSAALDRAVRSLRCSAGSIELRNEDAWTVSYQHGLAPEDVGVRLSDAEAPIAVEASSALEPLALTRPDPRLTVGFVAEHGFASVLGVPLQAPKQVIGALLLLDREVREFAPEEIDFARKLGVTVSLALRNAVHDAAQAAARRQAREEAEHTSVLLRAAEVLTSSMDVQAVLESLADLALEALGISRVTILRYYAADDELRLMVSRGEGGITAGATFPVRSLSPLVQWAVAEQAVVHMDYEASDVAEEVARQSRDVRARLAHWVPIVWKEELLGFLTLDEPGGRRELSARELESVQAICDQAAAAIANARAYEEQFRIAAALQDALLHPLPDISGWDLAAVTRSANVLERVGGDFHDVFPTEKGFVGALIGDVEGKGLPAAGLTETVRSAARALALSATAPAYVLERLNHLLIHDDSPLVTALFIALHESSGVFRIGSAGHPPPVLVTDRGAELLAVEPGLPLGAFADTDYPTLSRTLHEGEALVLYTDGVTDARRDGGFFGERGLLRALQNARGLSATELARQVTAALGDHELRDDVHVLVVRRAPGDSK